MHIISVHTPFFTVIIIIAISVISTSDVHTYTMDITKPFALTASPVHEAFTKAL